MSPSSSLYYGSYFISFIFVYWERIPRVGPHHRDRSVKLRQDSRQIISSVLLLLSSPARSPSSPPPPSFSHGLHLQRRRDRPLLRLPRRRRRARLLMHGRRLRDGQERRRRRLHGSHAPRARHEVHRPRRHGWSPRYLRPHHRRHHLHRDQPQGQAILPLRRIRTPLLRTRLRPRGSRRRNGHRHRRRRRSQGERTAAKVVCGHDPHPHLRRSACPVRPHCRHHPLLSCRAISCRIEMGVRKCTRIIHHCNSKCSFLGEHCAGPC